jgi:hypothetical protein
MAPIVHIHSIQPSVLSYTEAKAAGHNNMKMNLAASLQSNRDKDKLFGPPW